MVVLAVMARWADLGDPEAVKAAIRDRPATAAMVVMGVTVVTEEAVVAATALPWHSLVLSPISEPAPLWREPPAVAGMVVVALQSSQGRRAKRARFST
jgi:hypothetical protein